MNTIAQQEFGIIPDSSVLANKDIFIEHETGYDFQSENINNLFLNKFIKGDFIDENLKTNTSNGLKTLNHIGLNFHSEMNAYIKIDSIFKTDKYGIYTGFEHDFITSFRYNKNLFDLTFFGNQPYVGDTLQLEDTRVDQITYQKLKLGLYRKSDMSYLTINIYRGVNFNQASIYNGDFSTAANGTDLYLDLNGEFISSDNQNNLAFMKGIGLGLDFKTYLQFKSAKTNNISFVELKIEDIGFISWLNKGYSLQKDSNYYFQGFEINDLNFNNNGSFIGEESISDSLNIEKVKTGFTKTLTPTFSVTKILHPARSKKLDYIIGLRMRMISYYKPMILAGISYNPNKHIGITPYANYGGFGGLSAGIRIDGNIKNNFYYAVSSNNINGLFSEKGYGSSLGLSLMATF